MEDKPGNTVRTRHPIDALSDPPTALVVVLDTVALPVGRALEVHPGPSDSGMSLFAKQGLVVRVDVAVELRVAAGWEPRVRLGWGAPPRPGPAVTIPACPARGPSRWLVFPGGYWVDEPTCFPLVVHSQG